MVVALANDNNTATVVNQGAVDALINTRKSMFVNSISSIFSPRPNKL
jgi:hypothetical protein